MTESASSEQSNAAQAGEVVRATSEAARRFVERSRNLEEEVAAKLLELPYDIVHWRPLQCWLATVGFVAVLFRLDMSAELLQQLHSDYVARNEELLRLEASAEWLLRVSVRCFLRSFFGVIAVLGSIEFGHRFWLRRGTSTSTNNADPGAEHAASHINGRTVGSLLDQHPGLPVAAFGLIVACWGLALCPPPGWMLFLTIWRSVCTIAGGLFLCASLFEQANIYLPLSALCLYISGSKSCRVMLSLDGLAAASHSFKYAQKLYFLHGAKRDFHSRVMQAMDRHFHPAFVEESFEALVHHSLRSPTARRMAFGLHRAFSFGTQSRLLRQNYDRLSRSLAVLRNMMDREKEWTVEIDRGTLLMSSYRVVQDATMPQLLAPNLRVTFSGEDGQDEGGLLRDWFDSVGALLTEEASEGECGADESQGFVSRHVSRLIEAGSVCMMRVRGDDAAEKPPLRPLLAVHPEDKTLILRAGTERWEDFYALGRLLGLAMHHRARLPLHFSRATWKLLIGREIDADDVSSIDPVFFHNRVAAVLEPGGVEAVSEILCEPLCFVSAESALCPEPVELIPGGRDHLVTEDNKLEYVKRLCEFYICGKVEREWQLVQQGFQDLVPNGMLLNHGLTDRDLELLLVGIPTIDVNDWRQHTKMDGPHADTREGRTLAKWFWEAAAQFGDERRAKLLQFATGSSRLPAEGFKGVDPCFRLYLSSGSPDLLPTASTCINQLTLVLYPSKRVLIDKLTSVCHDRVASVGFGFL